MVLLGRWTRGTRRTRRGKQAAGKDEAHGHEREEDLRGTRSAGAMNQGGELSDIILKVISGEFSSSRMSSSSSSPGSGDILGGSSLLSSLQEVGARGRS